MTHTYTMGGTALTQYLEGASGWVVAMTGDFDGGVYAKVAAGPFDKGNGRVEYDLEHFFVRKDGSTIQTKDKAVLQSVPGHDRLYANTHYTVINATGAFEGMSGAFESWGAMEPNTGRGILRFSGKIGR